MHYILQRLITAVLVALAALMFSHLARANPQLGSPENPTQLSVGFLYACFLDANGVRGAVLLTAGTYEVSHPGVNVYDSGIVIRGQGQQDDTQGGTKIIFTSTTKESYAVTLGFTNGGLENIETNGVTYAVTDSYVPVGSRTLSITDASTFAPGDRIIVKLQPNEDWLLHSTYTFNFALLLM